jgi:hypothetical protein
MRAVQLTFLTTLIVLYGTTGVISFVAYFPTLRDLWHGKSSANAHSYALWTSCNLIALLYGLFVLRDLLYNVVASLQFLACGAIWILRVRLPK